MRSNDPLDGDSGGNGLQNFPVLEQAVLEGVILQVGGLLESSPSTDFSIELFASPDCDDSGFGEGQVFLGSFGVSTGADGVAEFDFGLGVTIEDGWVLTATAMREPSGATSEFSQCIDIVGGSAAAIGDDSQTLSSHSPQLLQNHPNPFRRETAIRFDLPREEAVRLTIHDVAGRLVRVLSEGTRTAGTHEVVWDGRSEQGQAAATGVYFYRLHADGESTTRQLLLTR